MKTRLLNLYANLMCHAIWAARRVFPPAEGEPEKNIPFRDYEWSAEHYCENCKHKGRHAFIEWLPERVTTATCGRCGLEATL
jgi:hypothetical protein